MVDDDQPVGRVLKRREFLAVMAAAGAGFLAACTGQATQSPGGSAVASPIYGPTNAPTEATVVPGSGSLPSCIARPEMTEGPYFVDERLNRSDIRGEPADNSVKDGIPLTLAFRVMQVASNSCTPLPGAVVDIWHCDAAGMYSDVTDQGEGFDTQGLKFLRGYQVTDANGAAQFTTIYPGWYRGRAVHIHFKIRTDASLQASYEFTSQLFFDDNLTDQVHTRQPYAGKGQRDMRNEADGIFRNGGDQLLLKPTAVGGGYSADFNIGLDLSNTQSSGSDT